MSDLPLALLHSTGRALLDFLVWVSSWRGQRSPRAKVALYWNAAAFDRSGDLDSHTGFGKVILVKKVTHAHPSTYDTRISTHTQSLLQQGSSFLSFRSVLPINLPASQLAFLPASQVPCITVEATKPKLHSDLARSG